jgi:phenylacetate-CoA ligase
MFRGGAKAGLARPAEWATIARDVDQLFSTDSAIPGIRWPAMPSARGMAIAALLFQLDRTQWLAAPALLARQIEQLRVLAAHAAAHTPFYRGKLAALLAAADDGQFLDAWRRLPVLERSAVQEAGDNLESRAVPPEHGEVTEIHTSGSVGLPLLALRTELWELIWDAFTVRNHLWHRRDLTLTLAAIRESAPDKALWPDGLRGERWGPATGEVFATGPCVSLNVTTPLARQAEWLMRQDPDYLLTHPTILERLVTHCREHGLRPKRLRQVETISEALPARVRELTRAVWGVGVVDVYSTRELGYLAFQCPEQEHLHVQAESALVEILGDHGRACAPGEIGRVVVTPLHNFAMPLLRYAPGDYAEAGGPCPCGRSLPVIKRVLGRRQNMLVLPSGERSWPLLSAKDLERMLAAAPIRHYQFVQRRRDQLELRIVCTPQPTAEQQAALIEWVRGKFGRDFAVTLTLLDELPLTPAGKFADFVSAIDAG